MSSIGHPAWQTNALEDRKFYHLLSSQIFSFNSNLPADFKIGAMNATMYFGNLNGNGKMDTARTQHVITRYGNDFYTVNLTDPCYVRECTSLSNATFVQKSARARVQT
jgi:hypothetical protein